ncbi:MAG: arsenate reductase-like glutaredoxin family protein, partial [Arcobacteraceae bacterium]
LEWLCKENMLLKRPIVEYINKKENKVLISFNQELYEKELLEN